MTVDPEFRERIEADAAGTVVDVRDADDVVEVVQRLPDDEGTYLYRVSVERHPDGSDSLNWTLLGSVDADEEA